MINRPVILCVDDEHIVLSSLRTELRHILGEDYFVETAESGEEALEVFDELIADGEEIPLVISDHIMPSMKGDELLKHIHDRSPSTLKIMLTGQASIEAVGYAVNYANLYRYIPKPWEPKDLGLTVKEALRSYQQEKKIAEKRKKLEKINIAMERFVPREFLDNLGRKEILDIHLGDSVQKEFTVLFNDIRSFTQISEQLSPQENFHFLNEFLSRMSPVIQKHSGFIDKYIGDAIMALFESPDDAVQASLDMLTELDKMNNERKENPYFPLRMATALNTGTVILGTVGSEGRLDTTVIGDPVNLASRLEELTKFYCVPLLISEFTLSSLSNSTKYHTRFIDQVQVKGKDQLVKVYEVFDADSDEIREKKIQTHELFQKACVLYQEEKFKESREFFQECLSQNPDDQVARSYLERC